MAGLVYYKKTRQGPSASSSPNTGLGDKVSFNNILNSEAMKDQDDYDTIPDKNISAGKTGNDYTNDPFGSVAGATSSQQPSQQPYVKDNILFFGSDA